MMNQRQVYLSPSEAVLLALLTGSISQHDLEKKLNETILNVSKFNETATRCDKVVLLHVLRKLEDGKITLYDLYQKMLSLAGDVKYEHIGIRIGW